MSRPSLTKNDGKRMLHIPSCHTCKSSSCDTNYVVAQNYKTQQTTKRQNVHGNNAHSVPAIQICARRKHPSNITGLSKKCQQFVFHTCERYKSSPTIWKMSYATFESRVVVRQVSVCNHFLANSMGPLGWLIQLQRNTIHVPVICINTDITRGGTTKRVVFNTNAYFN